MKNILLVLMCLMFAGCASLNSVSMTSYPKDRSKPVQAKVSKTVFLAFNFNNDFVMDLTQELQSQCPNGKVTGITTKYETYWYFIVHRMDVTSQGFCLNKG